MQFTGLQKHGGDLDPATLVKYFKRYNMVPIDDIEVEENDRDDNANMNK